MILHVYTWHDQEDQYPDARYRITKKKCKLVVTDWAGNKLQRYTKSQWDSVWMEG